MWKLVLFLLFKIIYNQEITKQLDLFLNEKIYKGFWDYNISNNKEYKTEILKDFKKKKGVFFLKIKYNYKYLSLILKLYDEEYQENWLMITLNYNINKQNNSNDLNIFFPDDNNRIDFFKLKNNYVNKTLFKVFKLFQLKKEIYEDLNELDILFTSNNLFTSYNFLYGKVNAKQLNLFINFTGSSRYYNKNEVHPKNYILFFISLINVYHFLTIYYVIRSRHRENPLYFNNFSSTLIGFDIIYNILITLIIASVNLNEYINANRFFSVPILYFFMIIFFEGVLFYFSFNPREKSYKKFITISFTCIIIFFILLQFLLIYPIFILIFLYSTFIPQIIHNISFNEKTNSIPKKFQLSLFINRLFIPLYLKGFKNNSFNSKTNYFFCSSILVFHGYQFLILYFQERISGDCIIPKKLRKNYYEYKRNVLKLIKNNPDFNKFQCSICLNPLISNEYIPYTLKRNFCFLRNKIYIYQTPCNHYFHIECLSNWMNQKKECPICRNNLPEIK